MALHQLDRAQARELVATAVKAPSSHNTQPWRFRVEGDQVLVMADRSRRLPVNDPDDRELAISCGTAAFTLSLATQRAGLAASLERLPDERNPDLLYRIGLVAHAASDVGDLFDAIHTRHTTRGEFTDGPIPERVVDVMTDAALDHDAWLHVVDEAQRELVAELIAEGDRAQFADPRWRRELASWMHPRRSGDGLAVPGILAPVVRSVVRHFDLGRRTAGIDRVRAQQAPLLAVLGTEREGVADWLLAGEALQHVLLIAAREGIQAGFLNQPCQVADLRPRFRRALDRAGHPQVVLRLGHPAQQLRPAPRRPVDAVMEPVRPRATRSTT